MASKVGLHCHTFRISGLLTVLGFKLSSGKIVVSESGVELAYTDPGAPSESYTTIFAVHGSAYRAGKRLYTCLDSHRRYLTLSTGIFGKIQGLAAASNVRIVAIARRNYPGSTPYTQDELRVITTGSEDEKTAFVTNYGVELITFIDKFVQEKNLPTRGDKDGIAIVGWSLGATVVLSAATNMKAVAPEVRARVAPLIKTFIFHDPSTLMYGIPSEPRWIPLNMVDSTITPANEIPFFAWWVSAYFQHGDLSLRSPDVLSFQVPSVKLRPPSAYSIASASTSSQAGGDPSSEIIDHSASATVDLPYLGLFFAQLGEAYQRLYDREARALIPNARVYHLGAEHSPWFSPVTVWTLQDEDKKRGGGFITARLIPKQNHFSMWDDPEDTLKDYLLCIAREI